MKRLSGIPFEVDLPALLEKLRIEPGGDDARDIADLVRAAGEVVDPKAVYASCAVRIGDQDLVRLDGAAFESRVLRALLSGTERAFPFIVTCGKELDSIEIPPDDFMKRFWLDSLKEEALRAAVQHFNQHVRETHGLDQTASMSPGAGSSGLWPIEQQRILFSLFGDTEALIGVRLTESCLMIPNKTVSGVLFPTEVKFENCSLCNRERCPERKAGFDKALWDSFHLDDP